MEEVAVCQQQSINTTIYIYVILIKSIKKHEVLTISTTHPEHHLKFQRNLEMLLLPLDLILLIFYSY